MKYCQEITDRIIKHLKSGSSVETACDLVGINKTTYYEWVNDNRDNFADRVKEAKAIPDKQVENAFFKSALGFKYKEKTVDNERNTVRITTKTVPPNGSNALNWLKNRRGKEWRDKQEVGIEGTVMHGIDTETQKRLDQAIDNVIEGEIETSD